MSDGAEDHPIIARLNRVAGGIADICLIMACLVLLWLVALTCVDVIGRYFFRSPVVGATELVQKACSAPRAGFARALRSFRRRGLMAKEG